MGPIVISGTVIHGKSKGRELGFPTINISSMENIPHGVYYGRATTAMGDYQAAIFKGEEPVVEAYLLGFSGDLYGQEVVLSIEEKIRDVRKFESARALKEQITKDVEIIKELGKSTEL